VAEVRFEGVWKRYGDVVAVRELTLALADGEFTVLVGPSGCGKTTSLRMVAGLEAISEGDLFIGDRRVNELAPRDRDIAMVFQSYALYPHMSVFENMAFGLRVRRVPKDQVRAKVTAVAKTLGLMEYLERKPKALSGGQRQRVAMGRAIVRDPAVFLFDEPLSNLDAKLRGQMRIELSRLHQRLKTTVLYVTHDQVEAMTLADRIVVMRDGLVQQVGVPRVVYARPANRFVAGFIGSPPMNFLEGELEGGAVVGQGFRIALPAGTAADGRSVVVGIRPEALEVTTEGDGALRASVEVVEPMGAEVLAHVGTDAAPMVVRLPGDSTVRAGDSLDLRVEPGSVHVFDPETEERIDEA
jgi:multiple sugar transport system ATP-binding protein